jgi:superfamily II DNA or RNA helicase
MVGVYATSTSTPLFFAQAVGRFVRARRRGETASIFLPSVPVLLRLAGELEEERDHVLGRVGSGDWTEEDVLVAQALQQRDTPDLLVEDQLGFEALESEATFDRILFDGGEFGTAPGTVEEEEFLGIPGLLDADQVSDLLRSRGKGAKAKVSAAPEVVTVDVPALKRELNDCVKAYARQSGTSQAQVHAELRRVSGGPEVARASAAELRTRIERVRAWAIGRR